MKISINKKIVVLAILCSFNLAAAEDGVLSSTESSGKINVSLEIASQILISGLDDLLFKNIDTQGELAYDYTDTVQSEFCVYSNEQFVLSVELKDLNGLQNSSYEKTVFNAPNDNIPVTYTLLKNQISEGSVQGEPIDISGEILEDFISSTETPIVDIMNPTCSNGDLVPLDNYILKAVVKGNDIKEAAAGYYVTEVTVRASVISGLGG